MSERVLLCGAWDEGAGYPRTRSLRIGLQAAGVTVDECRVPGIGRKKQELLRAPWRWPAACWQQRQQRRRLLRMLSARLVESRPDAIIVPYPGHAIVRAVKQRATAPVVLDLFLSAYDTVVEDRQIVRPGSLAARWLQQIDTRACAAADLVVLDTPENAAYVQALTGLPEQRFTWLPVHDPDAPPATGRWRPPTDGVVKLLFFGTGVPLHGLGTLIRALAEVPDVVLTLVGGTAQDRELARAQLGTRVQIEPEFVGRDRLGELLGECHLVAGVFGDGDPGSGSKVQRVVPFKVVHALAAGRAVITADTPAIARWLDGSGVVFVSPAGDVGQLAARLRELTSDPQQLAIAAGCARVVYDRHFGTQALATRCREMLQRLAPARCSGVA